ncbi:MAG: hypothetical protein GY754_32805 [bacterium]|nr:hypothetical protein [bacterium]
MDPQINQDVDYFFVIDSEIFFASGYRRLLEPVDEQFSKRKPEKTFLDISSTDIDDIIENIINLVDFDVSSQPMVDKESLLSLFKKKDPELIIHTNTDEVLSYEKNNISLYIPSDIPSENSNHVVIRIKTEENPIVDSQVHLAIKDEKKEYYTIRGTIFNEKTLKIGYHYRLDIIIEIKSIKSINNLKAILFFIQN